MVIGLCLFVLLAAAVAVRFSLRKFKRTHCGTLGLPDYQCMSGVLRAESVSSLGILSQK